jgi:Fe-S-cluster containining protein
MGITENLAWMRDFNRRFEAEVGSLYQKEPFWQVCRKCADGHCCGTYVYPVLNRGRSNPFLAEDWWMKLEHARDHFSAADRKQLAANIMSTRPACIFLFGNRCAVHASRPWTCRFHPYAISFYAGQGQYPVGEIALPSCPGCASSFGIGVDETFVQKPAVLARDAKNPRLIQVKLKKRKPMWLLDASDYVEEYEKQVSLREKEVPPWQDLLTLAAEAGGAECDSLPYYVHKVLKITPLSD